MKFEVYTKRDAIKNAAKNWHAQGMTYGIYDNAKERTKRAEIYDQLCKLNTDTCTAEEVSAIIGNDSWIRTPCQHCNEDVERAVLLNGPNDNEYGPSFYCESCLSQALGALIDSRPAKPIDHAKGRKKK